MAGRVYRRCACRDEHGKQLGARCEKLTTDTAHGTWTFAVDLPSADGKRKTVRRGSFETELDAQAALLNLTTANAPRDEIDNFLSRLATPEALADLSPEQQEACSEWLESALRKFVATRAESAANARNWQQRSNEAKGSVYYLRLPNGTIKIGKTLGLHVRLQDHRRAHGDIELLLTTPGYTIAEKDAHARWEAYRVPGEREVFFPSAQLMAWISAHQAAKQGARVA